MLLSTAAFSQMPKLEPGVSQELARWRAAHYSDVRYKLNLTLEKMSPVLKGTIEIRVKVFGAELAETLGKDRFLREIEVAASLQHPISESIPVPARGHQ